MIALMRRKAGFASWTSSIGQDRLSDGFVVKKGHLQYLFMVIGKKDHQKDDITMEEIELKLRACGNVKHDCWRVIGLMNEMVTGWVSKNHPLIISEYREIKEWGKNFCLFEKVL